MPIVLKARDLPEGTVFVFGSNLAGRHGKGAAQTAAWEFIASQIENGHPIIEMTLRRPPGKTGYVLKVHLKNEVLYIKLQLTPGRIYGRSFHYSNIDEET